MIDEIWKPVNGYENHYEVSNNGRIKSLPKVKYYFGHKKIRPEKTMNVKTPRNRGYLFVSLVHPIKKRKTFSIHRLVAEAFIPNPLNKPEVNHIDTNRLNNTTDNLEWLTREEHVIHTNKNIKFNRVRGEKHWKSKINNSIVLEIRELHKYGKNYSQISKIFNINDSTVSRIVKRKFWGHI